MAFSETEHISHRMQTAFTERAAFIGAVQQDHRELPSEIPHFHDFRRLGFPSRDAPIPEIGFRSCHCTTNAFGFVGTVTDPKHVAIEE